MKVRIHNITDRPNVPARSQVVTIARHKLRPGKFLEVDSSMLNGRTRSLHGTLIWIGNLPQKLRRTSQSALRAAAPVAKGEEPLTLSEARKHLEGLTPQALLGLCEYLTPVLEMAAESSKVVLVARVGRALFSSHYRPDPEMFFWLRRWTLDGPDYVEALS